MFLVGLLIGCATTTTTRPITIPATTTTTTTTQTTTTSFENYGMNVIVIEIEDYDVEEDEIYNTLYEVAVYLYLFDHLPSNYVLKANFNKNNYTAENKLSCGGNRFYNKEGLLPNASNRLYYELDIDYSGGGRNAKRIVYSNDDLVFYTSDHYASFSIIQFVRS